MKLDNARRHEIAGCLAEQRYRAVLAVIGDGETVKDVAARFGVARKTVPDWLAGPAAPAGEADPSRQSAP